MNERAYAVPPERRHALSAASPHAIGQARVHAPASEPDCIFRLQRTLGNRTVRALLSNTESPGQSKIHRQAPATAAEQAEFDKEREDFAKKQDAHFAMIGEEIRAHILAEAGLHAQTPPANAAEAA